MSLAFVWTTTLKDLRRRANDPWSFVFWLGMPILIAMLILLAFGGDDQPPVAHVLVVDHDQSFLSNALVQAMGQAQVVEAEEVEAESGRKRLDDGRASALLIIPEGFGRAVLDGRETTLELVTNPAQRILPGIVEETLSILVDAAFYLQRLFGDELKILVPGPPAGQKAFPNAQISQVSTQINERMGRIADRAFPPAIEVEAVVESTGGGPSSGFGQLFFPGILFMSLLFMAAGVASDVWIEREGGTLRRLICSPQRATDFLAGKVLAGAMLMTLVALFAMVVGVVALGVAWQAVPLGVIWSGFSGAVFLVAIMLIHLHASSARTAGVFTTMIIFPLLMVGGSFFPFESMPAGLAAIGRWTPNGWALTQLKAILAGAIGPGALATAVAGLTAVGVVCFLISAHRMRRGFAT